MALERIIPDDLKGSELLEQHLFRYRFALNHVKPGDVVLDAACGVGYGSEMLASLARKVIAVDKSREAISYAQFRYCKKNIDYVVGDLDDANFLETLRCFQFDVIVCLETLEHLKNPSTFIAFMKNHARRAIIVSTPIVKTTHMNEYHLHDFDRSFIENAFAPFLPMRFVEQDGIYGLWHFVRQAS